MSSSTAPLPTPEGPGSPSGAPNLPAVTRGEGPPLLLVHGWAESWLRLRMVMPVLARDFEVVAVDQRG